MTKESIIESFGDWSAAGDRYPPYIVKKAMDQWAEYISLEFSKFRDDFKTQESRRINQEQKRVGGIFSWIPTPDEDIYNEFLKSKEQ